MKERVLKILNDLRPEFDFSQAVNFVEEGMLDSFDVINLVTTLENVSLVSHFLALKDEPSK